MHIVSCVLSVAVWSVSCVLSMAVWRHFGYQKVQRVPVINEWSTASILRFVACSTSAPVLHVFLWPLLHAHFRPLKCFRKPSGNEARCQVRCFEWHLHFKNGRKSLEDNKSSGRPTGDESGLWLQPRDHILKSEFWSWCVCSCKTYMYSAFPKIKPIESPFQIFS